MDIKKSFDLIKTPESWKQNALAHKKTERVKVKTPKTMGVVAAVLAIVLLGGWIFTMNRISKLDKDDSSYDEPMAAASTEDKYARWKDTESEQEKADSKPKERVYVGEKQAMAKLREFTPISHIVRGTVIRADTTSSVMLALDGDYKVPNTGDVITLNFKGDCKNCTYENTDSVFHPTADYCQSGTVIEAAIANYSMDRLPTGEYMINNNAYAEAAVVLFEEEPNQLYRNIKEQYEKQYEKSIENMTQEEWYFLDIATGYTAELIDYTEEDPLMLSVEKPVVERNVTFAIAMPFDAKFRTDNFYDSKIPFSADGKDYYIIVYDNGDDTPGEAGCGTYTGDGITRVYFTLPFGKIEYRLNTDDPNDAYRVIIYDADTDEAVYELRAGYSENEN